jgi:hypothetical protein
VLQLAAVSRELRKTDIVSIVPRPQRGSTMTPNLHEKSCYNRVTASMTNLEMGPQTRETVLREQSDRLGRAWAQAWIQRLLAEGRAVQGGWPGTLQEARAQVSTQCNQELTMRGLSPLSHAELIATTNASYARAKHDWLLSARDGSRVGTRKP